MNPPNTWDPVTGDIGITGEELRKSGDDGETEQQREWRFTLKGMENPSEER